MENRIWNNMANIKFRSIYTSRVARCAHNWSAAYSIFLALASTSSVAAWALWEKLPFLWAAIVAVSQIMHIVKPHITFIKSEREFTDMSLQYGSLYLEYEKLWYSFRKEIGESKKSENELYALRQKEHEIEKRYKGIICPEFEKLIKTADQETNNYLTNNF